MQVATTEVGVNWRGLPYIDTTSDHSALPSSLQTDDASGLIP